MKNVFIDSNIWLSLYHFSSDDLSQFSKLKELVGETIRLLIPIQIKNEVLRNRDAKINDALKRFESFNFEFPAFSKSYPEYAAFNTDYRQLKARHTEWIKKVKNDILNQSLQADLVIKEFFTPNNLLDCSGEIINAAELRYKSGNPPGKDNKFGDAINWECLLANVNEGEELYLISDDKDYRSVADENALNLFLKEEWKTTKKADIHYYRSLSLFLKQHIKDIRLQNEQEKEELITALKSSGNFATTHAIIRQLQKYTEWTPNQKADLIDAALNNNQVCWIIKDTDVSDFYKKIIEHSGKKIEGIEELEELLNDEDESEPDIKSSEICFDELDGDEELPF